MRSTQKHRSSRSRIHRRSRIRKQQQSGNHETRSPRDEVVLSRILRRGQGRDVPDSKCRCCGCHHFLYVPRVVTEG
jgi:hypothetical protein